MILVDQTAVPLATADAIADLGGAVADGDNGSSPRTSCPLAALLRTRRAPSPLADTQPRASRTRAAVDPDHLAPPAGRAETCSAASGRTLAAWTPLAGRRPSHRGCGPDARRARAAAAIRVDPRGSARPATRHARRLSVTAARPSPASGAAEQRPRRGAAAADRALHQRRERPAQVLAGEGQRPDRLRAPPRPARAAERWSRRRAPRDRRPRSTAARRRGRARGRGAGAPSESSQRSGPSRRRAARARRGAGEAADHRLRERRRRRWPSSTSSARARDITALGRAGRRSGTNSLAACAVRTSRQRVASSAGSAGLEGDRVAARPPAPRPRTRPPRARPRRAPTRTPSSLHAIRSTGEPSRTAGPAPRPGASGSRLVAAGDARRRLVVDVGQAAEVAGRDQVGAVGARDLDPGEQRLARARRDVEPARGSGGRVMSGRRARSAAPRRRPRRPAASASASAPRGSRCP